MNFTAKLRDSNLRPTKQRLAICKVLFNRDKTFHFTINDLYKLIKNSTEEKVSLATVYNTVHSFKKSGYLRQINIDSDQNYFDTNISHHHHFFDENNNELIDLNDEDINSVQIKKTLPGRKIKSIEVLVKVEKK